MNVPKDWLHHNIKGSLNVEYIPNSTFFISLASFLSTSYIDFTDITVGHQLTLSYEMPHTNRKKKMSEASSQPSKSPKPKYVKRQNVEDGDGWTHVVGERRTQSKDLNGKTDGSNIGDFSMKGLQYIDRTMEEMLSEHESHKMQWESSNACTELRDGIRKYKIGDVPINSVVCLGLGSFQNLSNHFRRTSHTQLAALSTIIGALGEATYFHIYQCLILRNSLGLSSVSMVTQDPNFTDLDKSFLRTLGYTVTEDPEAFGLIESNSLVYAVHCYPAIYDKINIGIHPAMLIGNDLSYVTQWGT